MEKNIRTMGYHLLKLVIFSFIVVVNTNQAQGHDGGVSLKLNVTGTVGVQAGDVNANVSLTLIANATATGAVCLDGSAGGYYYDPGFGDGVNSWIIYLNGGGWCGSDGGCQAKVSNGGSSNQSLKMITFGQLHSRDHTTNPDFYNWNRVQVVYCDGSSFMGNADHSVVESRGARIFDAVMNEFFHKGMANATNVILTGGSAGGLATLLHCDGFRALFPSSVRVKCVIDSGFFLHA
ncbi:Pectin acetylesterase 8 [Striga hermonthica]|uniref:Pectin acetylesterase n=1 Tax=Striga hermonthica TaxID=68872 RepID=A0A9N7MP08_STRHE|nr:Pectin acetylesterase 8 [Striga hermonthica]